MKELRLCTWCYKIFTSNKALKAHLRWAHLEENKKSLINNAIYAYRSENPKIFSWEIRDKLLRDRVCCEDDVPFTTSIQYIGRHFNKQYTEGLVKETIASKVEVPILGTNNNSCL